MKAVPLIDDGNGEIEAEDWLESKIGLEAGQQLVSAEGVGVKGR